MEDSSDTQSSTDESMPDDTFSTQENTVDSTVNTEQQGENFSPPPTSFKLLPAIFTSNSQMNSCYRLSAELNLTLQSEVPDWSMSVEIGSWNSSNTLNNRFEVSPIHSSGKTTTQMPHLVNQDLGMIDLIE